MAQLVWGAEGAVPRGSPPASWRASSPFLFYCEHLVHLVELRSVLAIVPASVRVSLFHNIRTGRDRGFQDNLRTVARRVRWHVALGSGCGAVAGRLFVSAQSRVDTCLKSESATIVRNGQARREVEPDDFDETGAHVFFCRGTAVDAMPEHAAEGADAGSCTVTVLSFEENVLGVSDCSNRRWCRRGGRPLGPWLGQGGVRLVGNRGRREGHLRWEKLRLQEVLRHCE